MRVGVLELVSWSPLVIFCLWHLADVIVKLGECLWRLLHPKKVTKRVVDKMPLGFTKDDVQRLALKHVRLYTRMLQSSSRVVNKEDAEHYLKIWQGITEKGYEPDRLAPFERAEVLEALLDEDEGRPATPAAD